MPNKFPSKDDEEIYTVGFDFTDVVVNNEILTSATAEVKLVTGTDTNPSAMLLNPCTINGFVVGQQIQGGLAGNLYRIDCFVNTSKGNKYLLSGSMAVYEKNPPSPA